MNCAAEPQNLGEVFRGGSRHLENQRVKPIQHERLYTNGLEHTLSSGTSILMLLFDINSD